MLLHVHCRNELEDAGFPPKMEESNNEQSAAPSSTFVRIGSVQLSGNVTSKIRSRPLDRDIANITFELDAFDNLSKEIRKVSEANLAVTGRRGCTADEVYEILRAYFSEKLRKFLKDTVYDVSAGALSDEGSNTVREAKKLLASAKTVVKTYAGDAGKKTGDDLQESVAKRLEKLGVPLSREKLSALRELSTNAARNVDARNLAETQLKRLQGAYSKSQRTGVVINEHLVYTTRTTEKNECADGDTSEDSDDAAKSCEVKETIIIFPDW